MLRQRGESTAGRAEMKQLLRLSSIASLSESTTRFAEWDVKLPNTDWHPVERLRALRSCRLARYNPLATALRPLAPSLVSDPCYRLL